MKAWEVGMLDCKSKRLDYGNLLMPPSGFQLDKAIATTYSADLSILLSIPVALVYEQTLEGDMSGARLQLLEAVRQFSQRVKVYHQKGQLHVPKTLNWLYAYLEDCLAPMLPDSAFSSFHPKVWVLRYVGKADEANKEIRYRVIVLSRNLTGDRSWDLACKLDGSVGSAHVSENQPLADFIQWLDRKNPCPWGRQFYKELMTTDFDCPDGFEKYSFHPSGIDGYNGNCPWATTKPSRSVIISPFTDEKTLGLLKENSKKNRMKVFSEIHELAKISPKMWEEIEINNFYRLSENITDAEFMEGTDSEDEFIGAQKLHAKAFIFRLSQTEETQWYLGSANATSAARERNVEFMLGLRSSKPACRVESVEKSLTEFRKGEQGPFVKIEKHELQYEESEDKKFQQELRKCEYALLSAPISSHIRRSSNGQNWDLEVSIDLTNAKGIDGVRASVRPLKLEGSERLHPLTFGAPNTLQFQNISDVGLSRFLQFRIEGLEGKHSHEFLVRIEIEGLPTDRLENLLRNIVNSEDKFFEYLRLMLSDSVNKEHLLGDSRDSNLINSLAKESPEFGVQLPIYEQLLRMASREPRRLGEIDRLIQQLQNGGPQAKVIPGEFIKFWDVFRPHIPVQPKVSK